LVKINCVVLAGINDGEIEAFHDFSAKTGLEVRFLELLPAGPAQALLARRLVVAETILERLEAHAGTLSHLPAAADSTAFRRSTEAGAVLGFVAGQSRPFCSSCSRLRLSSRGVLHPCLFREEGVSLREKSAQEIAILVSEVLTSKPLLRSAGIARSLGALGG
jgi:cyclic pyranopterin phosphate synthase